MKWLNRLFGGPKDMAALPAGTKAPDFTLPDVSSGKDGGSFSLQAALQNGPVLAAFFKVSCPTCQYTFPFLERIHQAHGDTRITIVGISQEMCIRDSRTSSPSRFLQKSALRLWERRPSVCLSPQTAESRPDFPAVVTVLVEPVPV